MSRLRTLAAAAVAIATLGALAPTPAAADRVNLDDEPTVSNRAVWTFSQETPYIIRGDGVVAVDEADLGMRSDAFDGALSVGVSRRPLAARNGVVDVTGNRMRVEPRALAGLRVSSDYAALRGQRTMRLVVTLTNPGRRTLRRDVILVNGLGSDSDTALEATSSQDLTFDRRDRWTISSDAAEPDPIVTLIYSGRGDVAPQVRAERPSPDDFGMTTSVRVPARGTRRLLVFAGVSASTSQALVGVDRFDGRRPPPFALAGLSPAVRSSIVNWEL